MTQHRLNCRRFVAPANNAARLGSQPAIGLSQSPDGVWLALWSRCGYDHPGFDVTLWQREASHLHKRETFRHPCALASLTFSPDSRRLHALDRQGQVQTLQRQSGPGGEHWSSLGITTPSLRMCDRAILSADGLSMALSAMGKVWLFDEKEAGRWQKQYTWAWRSFPPAPALSSLFPHAQPDTQSPAVLLFSRKADHLLRLDSQGLEACHRQGNQWQRQPVEPIEWAWSGAAWLAIQTSAVQGLALDAQARWLAVAFWQDSSLPPYSGWSALGLWRFEREHGWQRATVQSILVPGMTQFGPLAMTFSCDSRQLAYAEVGLATSNVCILSCPVPDRWALSQKLPFGTAFNAAERHRQLIESLQFCSTGKFLAATAKAGIHIWQKDASHGWLTAAWIDSGTGGKCGVAFSPDGFHCALTQSGTGFICVCGPVGEDGDYRAKARWFEPGPVSQLAFTADGSHLLVTSWLPGPDNNTSCHAHLKCVALEPEPDSIAATTTENTTEAAQEAGHQSRLASTVSPAAFWQEDAEAALGAVSCGPSRNNARRQ